MALGKRKRSDVKGTRRGQNRPRKMARVMVPRRRLRSPTMVSFKRSFWYELWVPSTTNVTNFWRYYGPGLNILPSVAEIQNMFDEYRINGIKMTLRPKFTSFDGSNATTAGVTNQGCVTVSTILDAAANTGAPSGTYNSATWNLFAENGTVKQRRGTRDINIYFKPKVLATINGVNTKAVSGQWLSTNQTGIGHRGVHVFINDQNFSGIFTQAFDVFFTYYISCRGIR